MKATIHFLAFVLSVALPVSATAQDLCDYDAVDAEYQSVIQEVNENYPECPQRAGTVRGAVDRVLNRCCARPIAKAAACFKRYRRFARASARLYHGEVGQEYRSEIRALRPGDCVKN